MVANNCRDLGFSLADAKLLLDLSESHDADCQSVKEMAEIRISNVCKKIEDLRKLEAALSELTANCDGGHIACPLLGPLRIA